MRLRSTILLPLCLGLAISTGPASAQKREAGPGFTLTKDGTLIHRASHTQFPLVLAGFTRVRANALDAKGHDVAISYRLAIAGKPVVARIALIHMVGMTAKEHVLGLKPVIGSYFGDLKLKDVRPQAEGPVELAEMKPGSAYQARFRARVSGAPYEVSLTAVDFGYWDARLTAAYPSTVVSVSQARISDLIAALRKTGPKH